MEAQILYLYPGAYKSFDDLEEYLTMEEVTLMYATAYEIKHDEHRFQAAIQGVDIEESENVKNKTQEIIDNAKAQAAGMNAQEYRLEGAFSFIEE